MRKWHLIRTKAGAEGVARARLHQVVDQVLLPLVKVSIRQRDRTFQRTGPLFPTYLFAFFDLASAARLIRYTPGVRDIVRFGDQAAVVPTCVINEVLSRCADGVIDLSDPRLLPGAPLRIVRGPFQEFQAVFDGYRSGTERVAVLLSVMNAERRVEMPARMVVAAE
jgi:transcriptional antiterminator RfaH